MADQWIIRENWSELPVEGAKERFDTKSGQFQAYRRFRGPWTDRFNFLQLVLPQVTQLSPNLELFIRNYYYYPNIPGMVAHSADISGHLTTDATGPETSLNYEKAEILVTYQADRQSFFLQSGIAGQSPPTIGSGPILQTEYNVGSEIKTVKLTGDKVQDILGKRKHELGDFQLDVVYLNFKVTYLETPNPSWTSVAANLGKINIGNVYIPELAGVFIFGSAGIGTLRYDGPSAVTKSVVRAWNTEENRIEWDLTWNITHAFVYNRLRWDRKITGVKLNALGAVEYLTEKIKLYQYSDDNFAFLRREAFTPANPDDL